MKSSEPFLSASRRQHAQAILEKHVHALFRRLPMLCGFTLREDLEVIDVSLCSWPGYTAGKDLYEHLVQALADIAEERPEAVHLMRGRTFARAIH